MVGRATARVGRAGTGASDLAHHHGAHSWLVFEVNLWGYYFLAATLLLIVLNVVCGRVRLYLVAWLVLIVLAFYPFTWGSETFGQEIPRWLWQLGLVSSALAMGVGPLVTAVRDRSCRPPEHLAPRPDLAHGSVEF
jgi:hypothetical protein